MKRYLFFFAGIALLLAACARPVTPEGGPKDTQPPRLDSLRSTRNFATRFRPQRLELVFDEWIVLKDAAAQVVVSPPLNKRPEVTLRGHKVTVTFDKADTLRANTTYTLNFGTAIQDLHESNPAKDLRFVFSTGDFIDSLQVNGRVTDAFTGDPFENAAVMLYENLADSAIQKELPYYFARPDKSGQFSIQNVKPGDFRLVAVEIVDNYPLRWNPASERIAFADTLIDTRDTGRVFHNLRISKPVPRQRLIERNAAGYGRIRLTYAAPPDSLPAPVADTAGIRLLTERAGDTLYVWYDRPDGGGAWNLVVGRDSVPVRALSRTDFLKNHRVVWGDAAAGAAARRRPGQATPPAATAPPKTVSVNPFRTVYVPFNSLPVSFDTARWRLMLDSIPVREFSLEPDSAAPRRVAFRTTWAPGKTYRLTLLPGAVTDFFGVSNTDTLLRTFIVLSEKQLGTLALNFRNLGRDTAYVLQILDGNNVELERRFVAESAQQRLVFPNLPTVAFTIRLIEDVNGNGRWDPADFARRQQPETVFVRKLEALRANWEVEVEMDLQNLAGKKGLSEKK